MLQSRSTLLKTSVYSVIVPQGVIPANRSASRNSAPFGDNGLLPSEAHWIPALAYHPLE